MLSSLFRNINSSAASIQSNLFTHSWRRLASYSVSELCSYIASTPTTSISHLKWCKDRKGVKHEFLLLKVERPENGDIWLRLERRAHKNARTVSLISSPAPSGDSVELCDDLSRLFDASRSKVQVETEFAIPPILQKLGNLLSILMEDSPDYKLYSENCYFFCAVIYENLVSMGKGVNLAGAPSKISTSLAPDVKAKIKKRMDIWFSEPSPSSLSLEPNGPLPTEIPSVSPPTLAPSLRRLGHADGPPPSSFNPPLIKRSSIDSLKKSGPADSPSNARQARPDVRREPVRPDLIPRQTRMCVAVDFGTVLSGVACGISSNTVEQILWPGRNRKVPTCLVYDAMGNVAAWGHEALTINLEKGWIRCEMFKACLDPTGAPNDILKTLPQGKEPIEIITDYLRKLWENVKPKIIERGYTQSALKSADIWISIPATWTMRSGEMMRGAAYAAGLVAPQGSEQYAGGRDRLRIISEPEAAAVHCALQNDLQLKPNQSFMVCDAGGGTIDTAIYRVLGNVSQIAERCASSGASCGSHFLDMRFLDYLEEWHETRNIELSETNRIHYMHAFAHPYKLAFTGGQDAIDLHFECCDVSDYAQADLCGDEFFNGQLVMPAKVLRERVFDPIINNIVDLLEAQLRRVDSVDALLLVGEFSRSQYLFDRIWDAFHVRFKDRIHKSKDPDIATSLGAVQSALTENLIQRPIGAPTTIASKSYVIGIEANRATRPQDTRNVRNAAAMLDPDEIFEAQYLVVKGALLKKGVPILETFTKTSYDPSDSLYIARLYSSDSTEMHRNTSEGDLEHILDWTIDLGGVSSFKQNAQKPPRGRFDTVFDIGIEIESLEAHAVWFYGGEERGRVRLPGVPMN